MNLLHVTGAKVVLCICYRSILALEQFIYFSVQLIFLHSVDPSSLNFFTITINFCAQDFGFHKLMWCWFTCDFLSVQLSLQFFFGCYIIWLWCWYLLTLFLFLLSKRFWLKSIKYENTIHFDFLRAKYSSQLEVKWQHSYSVLSSTYNVLFLFHLSFAQVRFSYHFLYVVRP